jgi:hypothetical protein
MFLRSCIPQTRTCESGKGIPSESKCQIWTTSDAVSILLVFGSLDGASWGATGSIATGDVTGSRSVA